MEKFGKVFISHQSKDKNYAEYIVNRLGKDRCIYDKYSFEDGALIMEEIRRGLEETFLFVILLTKKALESEWVKKELDLAYKKLKNGEIKSILPIIIEENLSYNDKLIPNCMKERYNIKPIMRPKLAYNKIKAKMIEISLEFEGVNKEAFYGRNDEMKEFERRNSDFTKEPLVAIIASGFDYIGRKRFIEYSLKKLNIMPKCYPYNIISLSRDESIEDFILKIYDIGIIDEDLKIKKITLLSNEEKIDVVAKYVKRFQECKQYIFINDNDVIVKSDSTLVEWFNKLINKIDNCLVFGIASKYKLKEHLIKNDKIFSIRITELTHVERRLMLAGVCKELDIDISNENLITISNNLSGYPDQILFVAKIIKSEGVKVTLEQLYMVRNYSKDRVNMLLNVFNETPKVIDFLKFLCSLDIIDYDTINSLFEKDSELKEIFYKFISMLICIPIGSDGEYYYISDIIRDGVDRLKIETNNKYYKDFLSTLKNKKVNDKWIEETSISEYYNVIKQKITNGIDVDSSFVLPSHYIQSIVKLYNDKNYQLSIKISKRIINNNLYSNFDINLQKELYTFLCQALAREHNDEFHEYIKTPILENKDKKFLYGFFYRINGNFEKAIYSLEEAIQLGNISPKTKRELVNAYVLIDDYESAYQYSKDNYELDNNNPYYIQSYFRCLINSEKYINNKDILEKLLEDIDRIKSSTAESMLFELKALYYSKIKNNFKEALEYINDGIKKVKNKVYLLIVKFDIAYDNNIKKDMEDALNELDKIVEENKYYSNAFFIRKAKYSFIEKNNEKELDFYISKIKHLPKSNIEHLKKKLKNKI